MSGAVADSIRRKFYPSSFRGRLLGLHKVAPLRHGGSKDPARKVKNVHRLTRGLDQADLASGIIKE